VSEVLFRAQDEVDTFYRYAEENNISEYEAMKIVSEGGVSDGVDVSRIGRGKKVKWAETSVYYHKLMVSEFGDVTDKETGKPYRVRDRSMNGRNVPAILIKDEAGRHVPKKVLTLVGMAFNPDREGSVVTERAEGITKPFLMNVKLPEKATVKTPKIDGLIMPITDQVMLSDIMATKKLYNRNSLLKFFGVNSSDVWMSNFIKFDDPLYIPKIDIDSAKSYLVKGRLEIFVTQSGGVYKMKDGELVKAGTMTNKKGKPILRVYMSKTDGTYKDLVIANLVAKTWGGLPEGERRMIRYIDGNPANTHYTNLWWPDCGREFGF